MHCLKDLFGVSAELFASPMNSYLTNYCSVFPDLDSKFGSSGSFWHFNPTEGSYEANPPFVQYLMVKMVQRMETLLRESDKPLSFAVIVPAWGSDYEEVSLSLCLEGYDSIFCRYFVSFGGMPK